MYTRILTNAVQNSSKKLVLSSYNSWISNSVERESYDNIH